MKSRIHVAVFALVMVLVFAGTAQAQYNGGNTNVVVDPTTIEAGQPADISFDYSIWRNLGDAGACPWEVRLDGTTGQRDGVLLASGSVNHPGTGQILTLSVAASAQIPSDTAAGAHTLQICTSAADPWSSLYTAYTQVPVTITAAPEEGGGEEGGGGSEDTTAPRVRFWARKVLPFAHGKMTVGAAMWAVQDDMDPDPEVNIEVTGNEDIAGDWDVVNHRGRWYVMLRAQAESTKTPREYHIDVTVTDASGNETAKSATVKVHPKRKFGCK